MGRRDLKNERSTSNDSILSILVLDHNVRLCSLIGKFLSKHGFDVDSVHDGANGLATAVLGKHDLILLDAMLPVLDGYQVLRVIRRFTTLPIILFTTNGTTLEVGADDYIAKPFDPHELLNRVWDVLRRAGRRHLGATGPVSVSDVILNPRTREVRKANVPIVVTSVEFDILDILMRAVGRAVSRDELSIALYHRAARPLERTIDVHISHLRRKLDTVDQTFIRTIRGLGYQFVERDHVEDPRDSELRSPANPSYMR